MFEDVITATQVLSHIQQRSDRSKLEPKLLEITALLSTKLEPLLQRSQSAGSSATASLRALHAVPLSSKRTAREHGTRLLIMLFS